MKAFKFTVEGSGSFPLDMLRYDCCWPATSGDVAQMTAVTYNTKRKVELLSHREPTKERWKSFIWPVVDMRKGA